MRMSRKVMGILNVALTALLLGAVILTYLWPEHLPSFHLSWKAAQMLIMNIISALLLLGFFHKSITASWRTMFAFMAVAVIVESILMTGIWY
jgi:hypothetical protein